MSKFNTNFINRILLSWPMMPLILKLTGLLVFVIIVIIGLNASSTDSSLLSELRNTNAANLFVWSYWWPLIIISAILFGRVWCFACPMELVTSLAARFGFKRKIPGFLKSGWAMTILYFIILALGIHGLAIHRSPSLMAWYLIFIFALSIISGLVFEKNAFCAHLCPVGHLLSLYARLSPFGWRVSDAQICKDCRDKSCVAKKNRYRLINKSCAINLYPVKIEDNSQCIICAGCLKSCEKFASAKQNGRPNPGYFFVGFTNSLKSLKMNFPLSPALSVFILIVAGFVIYEILSEWVVSEHILLSPVNAIAAYLSIVNPLAFALLKSLILFLIIPLIVISLPYFFLVISRKTFSFDIYLKNNLPALVPIMAAAHFGKALLKMTSRLPYWPLIPQDIIGVSTARNIINKSIIVPGLPKWIYTMNTLFLLSLLSIGFVFSAKLILHKNSEDTDAKKIILPYMLPMIYTSIFILTIIFWRIF